MKIEKGIVYADEGKVIHIKNTKVYGKAIRVNEGVKETEFEEVDESQKPAKIVSSIDYEKEVVARIREKYTIDQELAILRQRDSKPEEFKAYNDFAEKCKAEVKTEIANELKK